jgi:hypothetical protein
MIVDRLNVCIVSLHTLLGGVYKGWETAEWPFIIGRREKCFNIDREMGLGLALRMREMD